jgi:hypothetical protein
MFPQARLGRAGSVVAIGLGLSLPACGASLANTAAISAELEAMSGAWTASHPETFRAVLDDAIAKDAYVCTPSARQVFFGPAPTGTRTIWGTMPHYGLYYGPMRYHIRRLPNRWLVTLKLVVQPPERSSVLELPDCTLRGQMEGETECRGTPFVESAARDACPATGVFKAIATERNVRTLLGRWSTEAEAYYNRDAAMFGIPVTYDFEVVEGEQGNAAIEADDVLALKPTCARTPYFNGLRSGWSLPVVSHELGHYLGLIDEYEMFSGIVDFYPKTPFPGAEVSRMGLSMKQDSHFLPIHHYLILRRYFCSNPQTRDPYQHVLN